jgi:hypothetical protein
LHRQATTVGRARRPLLRLAAPPASFALWGRPPPRGGAAIPSSGQAGH